MPGDLTVPGTRDFCAFVEAYFADKEFTKDTRSKAGHIVYRIPDHPFNISVPKGYDRLKMGTFSGLLDDVGISMMDFRMIAGTAKKLKQYRKKRKREILIKSSGVNGPDNES